MSRILIEKSKWIVKKVQHSLDEKLNNEYDFNLLFKKFEALLGVSMSLDEEKEKFFHYHEIVIVGRHQHIDKNKIQEELKMIFDGYDVVIKWVTYDKTQKYNFKKHDGDLKTTDMIIENRDHEKKDDIGLQYLFNRGINANPKVIDFKDYMSGLDKKLSYSAIIKYILDESEFKKLYDEHLKENDPFDQ
jgi:hypothetical protein